MKQIAENILIETDYTGVTLGAVLEQGRVTYIDAPLLPEHARLWRNIVTGRKKILQQVILLDAHYDRTIGSRYLECSIIAQQNVLALYQARPVTFKPISRESGSEWEQIKIQNGFRWIYPEIVFSRRLVMNQGGLQLDLQSHPGPAIGAAWVEVPARKVIFVGDAVVSNQVPFLGDAEIGPWLQTLSEMDARLDEGCKIVAGRSGLVTKDEIANMRAFLLKTQERLNEYAACNETEDRIDCVIPELGFDKYFKVAKASQGLMVERLSYGLRHYFRKNFMHLQDLDAVDEEEDSQ